MLRLTKYFVLIAFLFLSLSACGTSDNAKSQDEKEKNAKETENITTENNSNDETKPNEQTEQAENNQGNATVDNPPTEMALTYKYNGQTKEETAVLKESNNQPFSIHVLPAFDLRAVEPYNDEIYLKENDQIFMRINVLPKESDQNSLIENATAELQAVNENVEKLDPPTDFFNNTTVLKAANNGETVTKYIIEMPESFIKLSLFTTDDSDYQDALLQMAKTIKAGKVNE